MVELDREVTVFLFTGEGTAEGEVLAVLFVDIRNGVKDYCIAVASVAVDSQQHSWVHIII